MAPRSFSVHFSLTVLSKDSLKWLVEDLYSARTKWYQLGLQLGLSTEELSVINISNSDVDQAFIKMLEQWLEGENPSLEALAKALQTKSVNERKLSQIILSKICELISFPEMIS